MRQAAPRAASGRAIDPGAKTSNVSEAHRLSQSRRDDVARLDHVHRADAPHARCLQLECYATVLVRARVPVARGRAQQRGRHEGAGKRFALIQQLKTSPSAGPLRLGDQFQPEADLAIGEPLPRFADSDQRLRMTGIGVARSALTFAAPLAQRQDLLETFLFQVGGELLRRHVRNGVFAFERDDMAARRLQARDAGWIGAIDPEQRLHSGPADGLEPFDTPVVARQRPTLDAVADAETDVEARAGSRTVRRRLYPELVRRRDRSPLRAAVAPPRTQRRAMTLCA